MRESASRVWLATGDRAAQQHGGQLSFAGFSAYSASGETSVYADSVGKTRQMIEDGDGNQPGDPGKAAAAILRALEAERTPLRLPLGADAYDMIEHLETVHRDLEEWGPVIRSAAFD